MDASYWFRSSAQALLKRRQQPLIEIMGLRDHGTASASQVIAPWREAPKAGRPGQDLLGHDAPAAGHLARGLAVA